MNWDRVHQRFRRSDSRDILLVVVRTRNFSNVSDFLDELSLLHPEALRLTPN